MIVVDAGRASVSWRAATRTSSAALASNALHFASDLAGSVAVLVGLLLARAGHPNGDAVAALFVAVLVLAAAGRLMRAQHRRAHGPGAGRAPTRPRARRSRRSRPAVELRRLRMRHAGGRQFADVVIGVASAAPVGRGSRRRRRGRGGARAGAARQRRRRPRRAARRPQPARARACRRGVGAGRGRDPQPARRRGRRARASSRSTSSCRAASTLDQAHEVAEQLEEAIRAAVPELDAVQSHLEPLSESAAGREVRGRPRRSSSGSCARRPARRRARCGSCAPTRA